MCRVLPKVTKKMAPVSPELISPRSPRVAAARRLGKRNFRGKERLFLAEGPQAVREAAAHRGRDAATLAELFATPEAAERYAGIVGAARDAGARVHLASEQVIADISTTVTPQGLVGVCRFLDTPFPQIVAARPRLVAVLAHVRDPGNAGTVLRCADAAGADAVPVEQAVTGLRDAGVRLLAADGAGDRDLDDELDKGTMGGPTAWVFGNEAWGLPEETRALTDAVVRVPIHGKAESLNLATAAAVCLYASARAQRAAGGCRSVTMN